MASTLEATAIGYLVRDAFYTETKKNGEALERPFAKFRLLHTPYAGKDKQGDTISVDVTVNGPQAKVVRDYGKKGTQVAVFGEIRSNKVAIDKDGKQVKDRSGNLVINMEMDGRVFRLLGRASDNGSTGESGGAPAVTTEVAEDDSPF
jgi:single-stranded DNA-binding protein